MNDKTVPQCSCYIFHKEQNALIAVLNVELRDTGQVCRICHSPQWEKWLTTRDFWPKGQTMGVYYHYFGKEESCYMYYWNALHFRPWIKYRNGCGDTCNINKCRIVNVDKFKCSWKLHYRRKYVITYPCHDWNQYMVFLWSIVHWIMNPLNVIGIGFWMALWWRWTMLSHVLYCDAGFHTGTHVEKHAIQTKVLLEALIKLFWVYWKTELKIEIKIICVLLFDRLLLLT